ncbi:MAG: hypothetical protein NZM43_12100 [Saprospiraceae bacterium]|nr:hypothetical protein [Saprospiraceae bacterium]MDW8485053.1 hypothetical protein [Saprospiraceae bacterium]
MPWFGFVAFFFLLSALLPAQAQRPAVEWKADLDLLKRELPRRHPDLFRYHSREAFERDLDEIAALAEGKSDLEVGLLLQAALAKCRDLNTRVELSDLFQRSGRFIPIGLGWYEGGLYVSATVRRFGPSLGKRVLSINGIPADTFLQRIGVFFPQENAETARRDGPLWVRFPLAVEMAGLGQGDTLAILFTDEKGKRFGMYVYPLDFRKDKEGTFPLQFVPKEPDLRWNPLKQVFSLHWLDSSQIVYIQYNGCFSREMALALGDSTMAERLPPFQPILDSLLWLLDNYPSARCFFDLRFTNAGYPYDGFRLVEELSKRPLLNQPHRLYVAVNRYTAGPAVEIAAAFQQQTQAQLIGEPPAQRPNHFADPSFLTLPNSRLQVFYGTRPVQLVPGNPDALRIDIPMELPFSAFREGLDPLLDYVRRRQ